MKVDAKYLMRIMALGLVFGATNVFAAPTDTKETFGEIIFKIHDVVPEKDADGKVVYCNVGATFFNRTIADASNVSLELKWNDNVIGDIIDIEDREEKESKRTNTKEPRARYSTSSFTSRDVTTLLKLPPIKRNQQITLRAKIDTDRCFILLEDMDINVVNCGTLVDSTAKGACNKYFQYISPKVGEYYKDFKEISWKEELVEEDNYIVGVQNEVENIYKEAYDVIDNIVAPLTYSERADGREDNSDVRGSQNSKPRRSARR
jgi:hypothetical protein